MGDYERKKELSELLRDLGSAVLHGSDRISVSGLAYDSRKVRPGDLFVALRGERHDGHHYIRAAMDRGASAILLERLPEKPLGIPVIRVPDTRKAMARIAAVFYDHPADRLCLVGITGTNGKTTTSVLLESILEAAGFRVGIVGTLGYRWRAINEKGAMTTPESVDLQRIFRAMADDGVTHGVMEVSSHALVLRRVEGIRFDAAVFTNLSQDHLDFHESVEAYFQAKRRLFTRHLKQDAEIPRAVINVDDPHGQRLMAEGVQAFTYGVAGGDAEIRPEEVRMDPSGIRTKIRTPEGTVSVASPLMGRLNLYNILAAVGAATVLDIPLKAVQEGIGKVECVDGRLQRIPSPWGFDVVVDYAHTPDAMEKALECLREVTRGRLWVVFGCGGDRDRKKRPLMGEVAGRLGDVVVLTSDNPRTEPPEAIIREIEPGVRRTGKVYFSWEDGKRPLTGYTVEPDRKTAIRMAVKAAEPGDVIFVGGKGHETVQIIGAETVPFDDRRVVLEALREREAEENRIRCAGGKA